MDFQNVINKFHYEGLLAEFLPKVYEELINYLGEEYTPIIYEAFYNTEVVIAKSVYDGLIEKNMYEVDEGTIVSEGDIKRASGISQSNPDISFDGTNFKIEKVNRIVIIASFLNENFKNSMLSTIIHELGHLVKSYYNEYAIEGNKLIANSGLIQRIYELQYVDGKVKTRLISEKGVGIEEGLNTLLEVDICKKLIDPNYEAVGYRVVETATRHFYNIPEIRTMIKSAQMNREKEKFIASFNEFFMEGAYEELEGYIDQMYSLGLKQFANMFNTDQMNYYTERIKEVIEKGYNPLITRMKENREAKRN